MRGFLSIKVLTAILVGAFGVVFLSQVVIHRQRLGELAQDIAHYRETTHTLAQPTRMPIPTQHVPEGINLEPNPAKGSLRTDSGESESQVIYTDPDDPLPWGVAQKVDDVTYTIKVGYDDAMASPDEIVSALNQYRSVNGRANLVWDDKLGSYAQTRAQHFETIEGTDKHAGFDNYLENENGFEELRFSRLGENSFYGGPLTGTHLIEWVFSQSPGHNANQLDSTWTHIGVGVTESAVNIIFGQGQF